MWESQSGIQVGVIDRLKRSKTLSNVELVKNSKNPQSCLEIRPIQKEVFLSCGKIHIQQNCNNGLEYF